MSIFLLVYLVILHIKRKLPPADFFRIISKKKLSTSLFESYARQCDVGLLVDFYYQEDRKADNANILLLEGLFALVIKKENNFFLFTMNIGWI